MFRAGVATWEERRKLLDQFKGDLAPLVRAYSFAGDGPFLEGRESPSYADVIVGAWLKFIRATVPEWGEIREWHGGLWSRVYYALEEFAEVKSLVYELESIENKGRSGYRSISLAAIINRLTCLVSVISKPVTK